METLTATDLLAVPADLSLRSLRGWTAGVRLYVTSFAPGSPERVAATEEAKKQVAYAAWVARKAPATVRRYLSEQITLLDARLGAI